MIRVPAPRGDPPPRKYPCSYPSPPPRTIGVSAAAPPRTIRVPAAAAPRGRLLGVSPPRRRREAVSSEYPRRGVAATGLPRRYKFGCGHCESNYSALQKILAFDGCKKKELGGTCWDPEGGPAVLATAPPNVVDASSRREAPALTRRLEDVDVVGGLGVARREEAKPGKKKSAKTQDEAEAEDAPGDWTFDAKKGAWTPSGADAADFTTTGDEAIGVSIRSDVDGVPLDGVIIGVGAVLDGETPRRCFRVA